MKKSVIVLLSVFCVGLLLSIPSTSKANSQYSANTVNHGISINGKRVAFDTALLSVDGMVYVSIRELAELLGYEVLWDGERGEISLSNENFMEDVLSTSFEGVLSNGIRYTYISGDFSLADFCERNNFVLLREVEDTVLARTPTEAAERGQYHLHGPLRSVERGQDVDLSINVRYCSETDNWVLELVLVDAEPYSVLGIPAILAINRTNGKMVLYRSSGGLWLHEVVW